MAPRLFDRARSDIDRLMPIFDNAGIATRYSCVPIDWYLQPHGWRERNQLYLVKGIAGGDHDLGDGWDAFDLAVNPKAIHSFGGFSHDGG